MRPSNDNNLEILETGELVIARLSRTDTDNYTCHVENSVGSDRIHYSLVVQGTLDYLSVLFLCIIFVYSVVAEIIKVLIFSVIN